MICITQQQKSNVSKSIGNQYRSLNSSMLYYNMADDDFLLIKYSYILGKISAEYLGHSWTPTFQGIIGSVPKLSEYNYHC